MFRLPTRPLLWAGSRLAGSEWSTIPCRSAGHSKWSNIKGNKAKEDRKHANRTMQLLSQLRNVLREVKDADPKNHPKVQEMYSLAQALKIEKTTVTRTVEKFLASPDNLFVFEAKSPLGFLAMVECNSSDAANSASNHIRKKLNKHGLDLVQSCAAFAFDKKGIVVIPKTDSLPNLDELAIECGAEDWREVTDAEGATVIELICESRSENGVRDAVRAENVETSLVLTKYIPNGELVNLTDENMAKAALLFEKMDEYDMITQYFTNIEGLE